MSPQHAGSNIERCHEVLDHMHWLVGDALRRSYDLSQLPALEQRLNEIGDRLADARGFYNSAQAETTTPAETQPASGPDQATEENVPDRDWVNDPSESPASTSSATRSKRGGKS